VASDEAGGELVDMKTIEELNRKPWYRLLKVLYVVMWLPYPLMLYSLATVAQRPVTACLMMTFLYVLFSEGMRRAFYYVVAGAVFPKKKEPAKSPMISEEEMPIDPKPGLRAEDPQEAFKSEAGGPEGDEGAGKLAIKRWRRNCVIAAVAGCFVIIGSYVIIYECFNGFWWKNHSFNNGELVVSLPFELQRYNDQPSQDDAISTRESYKYGNAVFNVTISCTQLRPEYEYNLRDMVDGSLDKMKKTKELEIVSENHEDLTINGHPAARVNVETIENGVRVVNEYVYVIVAKNRCWFVSVARLNQESKLKEASDRILGSIRIKEVGLNLYS
jgi:hypothetical protein